MNVSKDRKSNPFIVASEGLQQILLSCIDSWLVKNGSDFVSVVKDRFFLDECLRTKEQNQLPPLFAF